MRQAILYIEELGNTHAELMSRDDANAAYLPAIKEYTPA
jgi:hypothetical protein